MKPPLGRRHHNSWRVIQFNIGTNSKGRPTSSRKSTTHVTVQHRWRGSRNTRDGRLRLGVHPATWITLRRPMGSNQLHQIPPATNFRCTRLPPTKIRPPFLLKLRLAPTLHPLCSSQWSTLLLVSPGHFDWEDLLYFFEWSTSFLSLPWTFPNWKTTYPITHHCLLEHSNE